ncbi:MAG: hypothetical protein ABJA83_06930 [Burkholderiaceae bacterium]
MALNREVLRTVIEVARLGSQSSRTSSWPARLLEHGDFGAACREAARTRQSGYPGPDDGNPKVF